MTHLAGIADRIDRPYSPCGGREGRDLDDSSKNMQPNAALVSYLWKQQSQGFIAPEPARFRSMHD
jgi:hypothetical protein